MPVKQAITNQRVPVKIWTDDVDERSKEQLANIAGLPFVHHHVAAMPLATAAPMRPSAGIPEAKMLASVPPKARISISRAAITSGSVEAATAAPRSSISTSAAR